MKVTGTSSDKRFNIRVFEMFVADGPPFRLTVRHDHDYRSLDFVPSFRQWSPPVLRISTFFRGAVDHAFDPTVVWIYIRRRYVVRLVICQRTLRVSVFDNLAPGAHTSDHRPVIRSALAWSSGVG